MADSAAYAYPDPMASAEVKATKAYGKQYWQAMYHQFNYNGTRMFYNNRSNYFRHQAYAQANQPVFPYQKRLNEWKTQTGESGESFMNVNWQILAIAPNFINILVGKIMAREYGAECNPLDSTALDARKQSEYMMRSYLEEKEFLKSLNIGFDPKILGLDPDSIPDQSDEVDIHMNMNYKDRFGLEAEMAIKLHLTQNDFDQIRKEYVTDMIMFGPSSVECRNDLLGNTKIKRLDPASVICSSSKSEDYKNVANAGYVENITFSELREMAGDEFTDEEYQDIYTKHCQKVILSDSLTNMGAGWPRNTYYNQGEEKTVAVGKFYFIASNEDTYEKKTDKLGNKKIYKAKSGKGTSEEYKKKYEGKREIIKDSYQVVYEGWAIIGSEYIFGYDLLVDMEVSKNNPASTRVPIITFAPNMLGGKTMSIVELCIPVFDEIQINWLQFQHCISKYIPDGASIDVARMINNGMGKGGTNLTAEELLDSYYKTGIHIWNSRNEDGSTIQMKPIEAIANSDISKAQVFLNNINSMVAILNRIIGLNDFTNGATPSPEALNGVGQMAMQGTQDALYYLCNADRMIFKHICESLVSLTQNAVKRKKVSGYVNSLGENTIKFWEVSKDISLYDMGINIVVKPTQEEWQQFYQQLQGAVDKGQLSTADMMAIQEVCEGSKDMKLARQMIQVREKRNEEQTAKRNQQNIAQQAQANQTTAVAIEKEKQATVALDWHLKKDTELALKEKDKEIMELKYKYELKIKLVDNEYKTAHENIKSDTKIAATAFQIADDRDARKDLKETQEV